MLSPAATTYTGSGIEVFFQSRRAGLDAQLTQRLVNFIEGTHTSLDGAIYDLRHPAILEALARLPQRHVRLRLAYDASKERAGGMSADPKSGGTQEALAKAGLLPYATAVHESGRHLMHDKFLVRDGQALWVGSANFTVGGLELQDNNCLIITSPQLAAVYTATIEDLLQPHHRHTHQDGLPSSVQVGGAPFRPYFAPANGEGIEEVIIAALKGARRIRVLAFLLSDPGILSALAPYANNPQVDIRGVYDPHGMQDVLRYSHQDQSVFWFLHDSRFVAAPSHGFSPGHEQDFMHNKVIIVDDHLIFTGSYNFSENAENNDETMLAIESAELAAAYSHYADTLLAAYKGTSASSAAAIHSPRRQPKAPQRAALSTTGTARSSLDRAITAVTVLFFAALIVLLVLVLLIVVGAIHL